MSPKTTAQSDSIYNDAVKAAKKSDISVQEQIALEENNFKKAIKADEPFEMVKEIRNRIKYLKSFLDGGSKN